MNPEAGSLRGKQQNKQTAWQILGLTNQKKERKDPTELSRSDWKYKEFDYIREFSKLFYSSKEFKENWV